MANPFCHVELQTTDTAKAKEFYGGLFDWGLEDTPMGDETYTMVNVGEGTGGGMMKCPAPNVPPHWLAYILVDDVVALAEKAKTLGGTVLMEKTEVPDHGWFSVLQDPTGAVFGIWQNKSK